MANGANISNVGLLFTKYIRAIDDTLNHASLARNLAKPSDLKSDGDHLEWVIHKQRSGAISYAQDGGKFPTASSQKYARAKVYRKFLHAKVKLTRGSFAAAKGGQGSARSVVDSEMNGIMRDTLKLESGMFLRDGTGAVAEVSDSSIGTGDSVLNVTDARMLWEGAQYDVFNDADGAWVRDSGSDGAGAGNYTTTPTKRGTVTVSSITEAPNADGTLTVTFDEVVGSDNLNILDGDFIVWKDSYGNVPLGLDALIDDGTGTFQNINVSTVPRYKSLVRGNSGNARPLDPNLFRGTLAGVYQKAGRDRPGDGLTCITSSFDAINVEELYEGNLRTAPDTKVAGMSVAAFQTTFGRFKVLTDSDSPYGIMFFVDPSQLYRWVQQPLGWRPNGLTGGEIWTASQDANFYTATLDEICEFYIRERHTAAKIEDLDVTLTTAY